MSDLVVSLRIRTTAEGSQVISQTAREVSTLGQNAVNASGGVDRLNNSVGAATRSLVALGSAYIGVQAAKDVVMLADKMVLLESRIKIATSSISDFKAANNDLINVSLQTGTSLEANITLFGRINKSVEAMGGSYQTTIDLTRTLGEGLKVSGASAGEAKSVAIQLSQAFSSGVLRGDEFNSVMENGSRIVDALTVATGKNRGELRKMAEDGQLTSELVINALKNQASAIHDDFGKIPPTIGAALENVTTQFSLFVDHVNDKLGATTVIANLVSGIGDGIGAISAIDAKMVTFGDTTASVGDYVGATWAIIKNTATDSIDAISAEFPVIGHSAHLVAVGASESLGAAWRIIKDLAIIAFNGIVGGVNAMGVAVGTAAAGIVQVFAQNFEKIKAMAAGLASGIESALAGDLSFKDLKTAYAKETLGFKQVAADVNKGIKDAVTFDYAGAIGGKIKEGAKDFYSLRTMIDANNAAMLKGAEATKKHADAQDDASKKSKKLSDAEKERKKTLEEAKRITEEFQTPQEKFNSSIDKVSSLYNSGKISLETFSAAYSKYLDDLKKGVDAMPDAIRQQEKWNQLVKDANELDALKDSVAANQSLAVFAEQLHLAGMTTAEISKQVDLQKALDAAVEASPNQDAQQVRDLTALKVKSENDLKNITAQNAKDGADLTKTLFENTIKNVQTSLAGAISSTLKGEATASFKSFADTIKNTLYDAVSQSLSAGIINGISKGDWSGVASGIIAVSASAIGSFFQKSAPTNSPSPSQTTAANYSGSGAFAIGDSVARAQGFEFASKSVSAFNQGITSVVGSVKNIAFSYADKLTSIGTELMNSSAVSAVKEIFKPLTNAISAGIDLVSGQISAISSGVKTLVTDGLGKVISSAGDILGAAAAIYAVYDYFSGIGAMFKQGDPVTIISKTGMMIGAVVAMFNPLIGGLVTLGSFIVGLFNNIRKPNYWVNSFSQKDGTFDPVQNKMGDDGIYTRTGNKSAFIGTSTPFGNLEISSHELSLSADDMRNSFGQIIKTVKGADVSLAGALNSLDDKFGQSGQTMARFIDNLTGNRIALKQDASNVNVGAAIDSRYGDISALLAKGGTQAGAIASSWYDMLTSKFSEQAKKDNPGLSVGIVTFLGQALPTLAELPKELVGLVGQSISVLTKDNPGEDLVKQSLKVVEGFAKVQYGFAALGATAGDAQIVGFLGSLTKIGITAGDASNNLVGYAQAIKSSSHLAGEALTDEIFKSLNDLAAKGLNSDQYSGMLSTVALFSSVANDIGLAVSKADLETLGASINATAQSSVNVANEQINAKIAAENLGKMEHSAAVQQLILSGKIDQATVSASNYGVAVTNAQKSHIEVINAQAQMAAMYGSTLSKMGVKFDAVIGAGDTLTQTFGTLAAAMNVYDAAAKSFLNPQQYSAGKQSIAQANFDGAKAALGSAFKNISLADVSAGLLDQKTYAGYVNLNSKEGKSAAQIETDKQLFVGLTNLVQAATQLNEANKTLNSNITDGTPKITTFGEAIKNVGESGGNTSAILDTIPRTVEYAATAIVDTTQLQIKLYETLGDKTSALKLTREAELKTLDATSAAIQKQIYAAEDLNNARDAEKAKLTETERKAQEEADQRKRIEAEQASAAEKAHQRQITSLNKQAELYSAQGNSIAATNLQREIELSTMDAALVPTQKIIYALQDQAKATDLLNTAINNYKASAVDASKFIADFKVSISDWAASHKAKDQGSPETQLKNATDAGYVQLQKALGGDKKALGSITTYADNYLSAIDKYYGGSAVGEAKKSELMAIMQQLPDQLTVDQILQDGFKNTVDALKDLPSKIADLQSHLTNDIAAMVMKIDISANMPQELRDLAHTVAGNILVTVNAIAGSHLPDPIRAIAMGELSAISTDLNVLANATLDPVLITLGLNSGGVLAKDVKFYVTAPNLSDEVRALGLGVTGTVRKYAEYVVSSQTSNEVKILGLNVLGIADKYARMIVTSDLDTAAKNMKLAEADAFVKSAWLSITTTGDMTAEQKSVINALPDSVKTQTVNQVINTNGSAAGLQIAGNITPNSTSTVNVNSVLTYGVDLANSLLGWSKSDVSTIYTRMAVAAETTQQILSQWLPAIHDGTYWTKEHTKWTANNIVAETEALVRRSYGLDGNPTKGYKTFSMGGIANRASIFGEAGPEAAVPLPDGRTIPVTLRGGNNSDVVDKLAETNQKLDQLAEQNRLLRAVIEVLQSGFGETLDQAAQQNKSLASLERKQRIAEAY